jgi:hypothetical protein
MGNQQRSREVSQSNGDEAAILREIPHKKRLRYPEVLDLGISRLLHRGRALKT